MTAPPRASNRRDQPVIEMSQVVKTYKTPAGEFHALRGVSVTFRQGEFVSVVGKSGSGKSTLINMVTGIDHPTSGSVRVGDTLIHKLKEGQMAEWRGANMGIVFQFFQLLPMLTVLENVVLPMDFCNIHAREEREPLALELLDRVGLADVAGKMPAELSGGQQQSAAIARALANDPPILVADEPTGNLDSRTAETVFQIFCDLARAGKTILMVTHDNSLAKRTTRTVLICDGELIDEQVARAFPTLPDPTLLHLTKTLKQVDLAAGQMVSIGPGNYSLTLMSAGTAEAVLFDHDNTEAGCLPLQVGDMLSLADAEGLAGLRLVLRATGGPAHLLALDAAPFAQIAPEHSSFRDLLVTTAQQRAAAFDTLFKQNKKWRPG